MEEMACPHVQPITVIRAHTHMSRFLQLEEHLLGDENFCLPEWAKIVINSHRDLEYSDKSDPLLRHVEGTEWQCLSHGIFGTVTEAAPITIE